MRVVHDQKPVDIRCNLLHRVADHDHRRALRCLISADVLQNTLAPCGVESCRRLIQNQNIRLHRNHARNRGSALLPAGEVKGRFLKLFVCNADKARRTQHARADFLLGKPHVFGSEGDILKDRLFKKLILRVLEHQTHMEPEPARELHILPDILSLKQDLPAHGL